MVAGERAALQERMKRKLSTLAGRPPRRARASSAWNMVGTAENQVASHS